MTKKLLPLAGLSLAVFLGTYLLIGGELPNWVAPNTKTSADSYQQAIQDSPIGRAGPEKAARDSRNRQPEPEQENLSDAEADSTAPGEIRGRAVDQDGRGVELPLNIEINPPAGRILHGTSGEFRIVDLPPRGYQVGVGAEGHMHLRMFDLMVRPGRTTHQNFALERGILPAGIVVDETTAKTISGALIRFGDGTLVRSQADGSFRAPYILSKRATDRIRVSHEAYDHTNYVKHPWPRPSDLRLALSRGTSDLKGRLLLGASAQDAKKARLDLYFTTGGRRQLRRTKIIDANAPFHFPHVSHGTYLVSVSFPGTKLPERHERINIKRGSAATLDISVSDGAPLAGTLKMRAGLSGFRRIDIVDLEGQPIVSTKSDKDGNFNFPAVPPGTWRARIHIGQPWFFTGKFKVGIGDRKPLIIDCDTRRVVR